MDDQWFRRRFGPLKWLGYLALAGAAIALIALALTDEDKADILKVAGLVLIVPVFVYCFLLPFWHWKERYIGGHCDLWGALLIIETSSFSKIVYWFRHILADWQEKGRYARRAPASESSSAKPAV